MILVMNCMKEEILAQSFNRALERTFNEASQKTEFRQLTKETGTIDVDKYSHFILSGSEASARDDNPWDSLLTETIQNIVKNKKPLMGICYGHQFIVRALIGREHVRKAEKTEMGWRHIRLLKENPLLGGLVDPVIMVSHYDEVFNLPSDFTVTASSPDCNVHSYQYKNLPVWGVQFHPEYNVKEAEEIFDMVSVIDPLFESYYINELQNEDQISQNRNVLFNFLAAK